MMDIFANIEFSHSSSSKASSVSTAASENPLSACYRNFIVFTKVHL